MRTGRAAWARWEAGYLENDKAGASLNFEDNSAVVVVVEVLLSSSSLFQSVLQVQGPTSILCHPW